jgi:hypothetical protein
MARVTGRRKMGSDIGEPAGHEDQEAHAGEHRQTEELSPGAF